MCVACGGAMTSTGCRPGSASPSSGRSPWPSRTGTMSSTSSSTAPADSAWRTVEAPPAISTSPPSGSPGNEATEGDGQVAGGPGNCGQRRSGVDAGGVQLGGTADDEVPPRPDLAAHEQVEDLPGGLGVLDPDPPHN